MIKNINTGICNNFNKIVKRNFKGSYTIEAALIMPIIFIVLAGIIYISFYLHDIVWIQGISYESSHILASQGELKDWKIVRPEKEEVLKYAVNQLENGLLLIKSNKLNIELIDTETISNPASYVRIAERAVKILHKFIK